MTENSQEVPDTPQAAVRNFEQVLGMPPGFYRRLLDVDDWAFVIQLHALVEAATTHVIVGRLDRQELTATIARLNMAGSTGKLAFAKELGCIGSDGELFVRRLGEIRNRFVHDVRNVGMTLEKYVADLDAPRLNDFRRAFGPGCAPYPIGDRSVPEEQFVRENPKLTIWISGLFTMAMAYCEHLESDVKARMREAAWSFYEAVAESAPDAPEGR